jgi:hypothetical protein
MKTATVRQKTAAPTTIVNALTPFQLLLRHVHQQNDRFKRLEGRVGALERAAMAYAEGEGVVGGKRA